MFPLVSWYDLAFIEKGSNRIRCLLIVLMPRAKGDRPVKGVDDDEAVPHALVPSIFLRRDCLMKIDSAAFGTEKPCARNMTGTNIVRIFYRLNYLACEVLKVDFLVVKKNQCAYRDPRSRKNSFIYCFDSIEQFIRRCCFDLFAIKILF